MDRIRVLRVIDRLNVGGPALQTTVLSEGLDASRFDHRVLTGSVSDEEGDYTELRAPHLVVERIAGLGREPSPARDLDAWRQIERAIRQFRPHIVHTHKAKAGVLGRLAAWTHRGTATVHSYHGHLLHGYFSRPKTTAVVAVERALAWPTTKLVAVGTQVRDELLAAGIGRREQYVVVPPGVRLPTPPDRRVARAELGIPVDGPVITFVGRLTQVKRPERFVELAAEVAHEHPDASFVVAGGGELLDDLRARAQPLGRRMRFLGWRSDVEVIYAASDVVVLTSDNEGMPVSLIEAATLGVPTVTTRVGSAAEVVDDGVTGFVTPVGVRELAQAVRTLLDDDALRARMGRAASAKAAREFSAARLVADMSNLYEDIVRARVPGSAFRTAG